MHPDRDFGQGRLRRYALRQSMGPEAFDHMMGSCFSRMDRKRREFMLGHCRGLLDQMEEKCLRRAST